MMIRNPEDNSELVLEASPARWFKVHFHPLLFPDVKDRKPLVWRNYPREGVSEGHV